MRYCTNCGVPLAFDDASFCTVCGAAQPNNNSSSSLVTVSAADSADSAIKEPRQAAAHEEVASSVSVTPSAATPTGDRAKRAVDVKPSQVVPLHGTGAYQPRAPTRQKMKRNRPIINGVIRHKITCNPTPDPKSEESAEDLNKKFRFKLKCARNSSAFAAMNVCVAGDMCVPLPLVGFSPWGLHFCSTLSLNGTGDVVELEYDEETGFLTRPNSHPCGLDQILTVHFGNWTSGSRVSSFSWGSSLPFEDIGSSFDLMSDGSIQGRWNSDFVIGATASTLMLVKYDDRRRLFFHDLQEKDNKQVSERKLE